MAGFNFYSILHATLLTLCSGFVLISSAAGPSENLNFFTPGEAKIFKWKSSVSLNEIQEKPTDIGFALDGTVVVSTLWGKDDKRLLKFELAKPKLQTKSKKGEFNLDKYQNGPFMAVLNKGALEQFFIHKDEQTVLKNLKKGIASLFQFHPAEGPNSETDASGLCNTSYSFEPNPRKAKLSCASADLSHFTHQDDILGVKVLSNRKIDYVIHDSLLKAIKSKESHEVLQAKKELATVVNSEQILIYEKSQTCSTIDELQEAVRDLTEESLLTKLETPENIKSHFGKSIGALKGSLKAEHLGTVKSAKAFLQILEESRTSSSEEISKVLGHKRNEEILPQIYDILGYTQTEASHRATMKHLHLDNEEHASLIERYLWALSFSTHPNVQILEDLLEKWQKYASIPSRIKSTLILSLASMGRTLRATEKHLHDSLKVLKNLEEAIINGLDYAKDEERYVYINALKNLRSPSTIPNLERVLEQGTLKEEVLAWRALETFGKDFWTPDILKKAEKTVLQLDKRHDSSSRTIALDLLLQTEISDATLRDLLSFAASNDPNFEIKQYVFQSIKMHSEKCEHFNRRVNKIIASSRKLNNYSSLSPKGLSTALARNMFKSSSINGSLVSVQEIKGGIVKRGVVDVILHKNNLQLDLFSLGIFASGLSSFTSSGSEDKEESEEEATTAGMEISVMGTQIRPFVFFEGQGELMGHVWSGTASELTPAFQALILAQRHKEYIRLGNGFIFEIDLDGAISFDLSGKIEISIWSRNAQSLIEKSIGYLSRGAVRIDTSLIKSQLKFEGSIEPKLSLEIDADFSSDVKLCMRLSQPNSVFRQGVSKSEAIPGSKYQQKSATNRKLEVPGITYALNRKNSEMCSAINS